MVERDFNRLPIKLEPKGYTNLTLTFELPVTAEPGLYQYEIRADSYDYPGETARRSQQLQVIASDRYLQSRNEPTFSVSPQTSSETPYTLSMGDSIEVTVQIENRSRQVERFSMSCPELQDWLQQVEPQELPLFPGQSGTIKLTLKSPSHAIAGNYFSTLRLNSQVQRDLTFLDILYLTLQVDDRLSLSLIDNTLPKPSAQKRYTVQIQNQGNVERSLKVIPHERTKLFHYVWKSAQFSTQTDENPHLNLISEDKSRFSNLIELKRDHEVQLSLAPREELQLQLIPKLTLNPFRRLWFGRDREVPFQIELVDAFPENTGSLFTPESQSGTLLWKPYPRWLLGLLLLLPVLLLLKFLSHKAYFLFWESNVKPSLMPQITELSTAEKAYQEGENKSVRLNIEIRNSSQMKKLELKQTVDAKNEQPKILPFTKNDPACQPGKFIPPKSSWLQQLWESLYSKMPEMEKYKKYEVLRCQGITTQASQAGTYSFELTTYVALSPPKKDESNPENLKPRALKKLQGVQIASANPAAISTFTTKATVYREAGSAQSSPTPKLPNSPILLNWSITNPKQLSAIELSWVHLGLDGKVTTSPVKGYSVTDGVLEELGNCKTQGTLLICDNIPTAATFAGQYSFTLTPIPIGNAQPAIAAAKTIQNIQVRPPLPQIAAFIVNGKSVIDHPKQVVVINPAQGALEVPISWTVPNRDKMKVELLPSPRLIDPTRPSTLTYPLSPKSNNEIVLKVTNQVGETIEQSVVIETTEYIPPERAVLPSLPPLPPAPLPPDGATPSGAPSKPPEKPEELVPYELPPQSN
jgi:hypothetical protein